MTTLLIVLFLDAMFGGTQRAEIVYATPAACQAMLATVRKLTVKHVVERDCAPAGDGAVALPEPPPPPTPLTPAPGTTPTTTGSGVES